MKGSASLELTVLGSKSKLRQILDQTRGIASYELQDSSEKKAVDAVIKMEGNIDLRENLFYRLAEEKMPILRMQHTNVSLEDVFLELTGEETEAGENETEISGDEMGKAGGFRKKAETAEEGKSDDSDL